MDDSSSLMLEVSTHAGLREPYGLYVRSDLFAPPPPGQPGTVVRTQTKQIKSDGWRMFGGWRC